jgi:methyl-accepting chemotaxis protein
VTFDYMGEPWIGYFDEVPQMDWHVIVQVPVSEVNAPLTRLVTVLVVAMVALLAVTILVSIIVGTYIVKPLTGAVNIADRVAAGDLNVSIDVDRKDEIGKLSTSMRSMVDSLREKGDALRTMAQKDLTVEIFRASDKDSLAESMITMRDSLREVLQGVQLAVEQVAAGSDQVSNASQALSQGATESAASLEEISSSVNQINGQARQNADNANEASSIARDASSQASEGDQKMTRLQEAMTNISDSSEQISKIVKTIDDIAFQINLLALNANVEAARAGKYGKGFAVVAEEVRNLAVRSADAVQETSAVVEESLRSISSGHELSEETGQQLRQITEGSAKVATLLEEIAAASKEQSQAIDQVTEGLGQVDDVTQQNTASAEESASASEELASQAELLKRTVAEFTLGSSDVARLAGTPSGNNPNGNGHGRLPALDSSHTDDSVTREGEPVRIP